MSDHATTIDQIGTDRPVTDLDGRDKSPARQIGWAQALTVATVVPLLGLSFVLGRASNHDSRVQHPRPAPAGLSLQAGRQADARLVQANVARVSDSGQSSAAGRRLQAQRQAQARLVQANGTHVNASAHNLLSLCQVGVPC